MGRLSLARLTALGSEVVTATAIVIINAAYIGTLLLGVAHAGSTGAVTTVNLFLARCRTKGGLNDPRF